MKMERLLMDNSERFFETEADAFMSTDEIIPYGDRIGRQLELQDLKVMDKFLKDVLKDLEQAGL